MDDGNNRHRLTGRELHQVMAQRFAEREQSRCRYGRTRRTGTDSAEALIRFTVFAEGQRNVADQLTGQR